jgi:hypothetical protein
MYAMKKWWEQTWQQQNKEYISLQRNYTETQNGNTTRVSVCTQTQHPLRKIPCDMQVAMSPFSRQLHFISTTQLHNFTRLNFIIMDISFNNMEGLETKIDNSPFNKITTCQQYSYIFKM